MQLARGIVVSRRLPFGLVLRFPLLCRRLTGSLPRGFLGYRGGTSPRRKHQHRNGTDALHSGLGTRIRRIELMQQLNIVESLLHLVHFSLLHGSGGR